MTTKGQELANEFRLFLVDKNRPMTDRSTYTGPEIKRDLKPVGSYTMIPTTSGARISVRVFAYGDTGLHCASITEANCVKWVNAVGTAIGNWIFDV